MARKSAQEENDRFRDMPDLNQQIYVLGLMGFGLEDSFARHRGLAMHIIQYAGHDLERIRKEAAAIRAPKAA